MSRIVGEDHNQIVDVSDQSLGNGMTVAAGRSDAVFLGVEHGRIDEQTLASFLSKRPIGAYRVVEVDVDRLRTLIRESPENGGFSIRLLDDEPIELAVKGANESSSGWSSGFGTWVGAVEGDETSRASFVVGPDSSLNGVVRTLRTGRIEIEPIKGTPYHLIWAPDSDSSRRTD